MNDINVGDCVKIGGASCGEALRVLQDGAGQVVQIKFLGDCEYKTGFFPAKFVERVDEKELVKYAHYLIYALLNAIDDSTQSKLVKEYIKEIKID